MIAEYKGWRILLQVCYDLRFPVWSRNRDDYDMILYVASWPTPRVEAWNALLKARAIENVCYVAGVNRVGDDPELQLLRRDCTARLPRQTAGRCRHGRTAGDALRRSGQNLPDDLPRKIPGASGRRSFHTEYLTANLTRSIWKKNYCCWVTRPSHWEPFMPGLPACTPTRELPRRRSPNISRPRNSPRCAAYSRWCTNEKTAMEAALGVSYVGKRALVCMKHVGLNVAADAFVNSAVTGTNGGLVVLVADDPSMHSVAKRTGLPLLRQIRIHADAGTFVAARSLRHDVLCVRSFRTAQTACTMRITTRMAHSRAVISPGRIREQNELGFPDDAAHWVLLPVNARRCYGELLGQQPALEALAAESSYNSYTDGPNRKTGVIACGIGSTT